MTEYNKLNHWYGWNGGECPVHPKTVVQGIESNGSCWRVEAIDNDWGSFRGCFKIIEEFKEPREFWVNPATMQAARHAIEDYIHVREVIGD